MRSQFSGIGVVLYHSLPYTVTAWKFNDVPMKRSAAGERRGGAGSSKRYGSARITT